MSILVEMFKNLSLVHSKMPLKLAQAFAVPVRYKLKERKKIVEVPKPGGGKAYRRKVHFPEEYTIEPLQVTNLGGRDPVTGRLVCKGIGGGIKHKYHWIKWFRDGPTEDPPQEEKVIKIIKCGCRTADVALVAFKDQMKYILATANMKAGDIIKTSRFIPQIPVKPNEGDAYPLKALPIGIRVHNVQLHPTTHTSIIHAAGTYGTIKRHVEGKVVVEAPSKKEMLFEPECMATVGQLSNIEHSSTPIGSAQRSRELGNRPRSGLWQRKTGRFGRKIKRIPPLGVYVIKKPKTESIPMTHPYITI